MDIALSRSMRIPTARLKSIAGIAFLAALTACGGGNSGSKISVNDDKQMKTQVLEAGAAVLQNKPPIEAINTYLDGFHFYSGNLQGQMEAHHYCSLLNDDIIQCVIYDGNVKAAKLMGIEYVISGKLFASLPNAEKALWHSHVHEVKSGQLIAPGIPRAAEHELMKKLVGTYGKTWHTWHTDMNQQLPLGVPQLMMGFTQDGQINTALVQSRDRRFEIDSAQTRAQRADIAAPTIDPLADAWQRGRAFQIEGPAHDQSDHAAQ